MVSGTAKSSKKCKMVMLRNGFFGNLWKWYAPERKFRAENGGLVCGTYPICIHMEVTPREPLLHRLVYTCTGAMKYCPGETGLRQFDLIVFRGCHRRRTRGQWGTAPPPPPAPVPEWSSQHYLCKCPINPGCGTKLSRRFISVLRCYPSWQTYKVAVGYSSLRPI